MRRFRNPAYAPEFLERKLSPVGISGIPVAAEVSVSVGDSTTDPADLGVSTPTSPTPPASGSGTDSSPSPGDPPVTTSDTPASPSTPS